MGFRQGVVLIREGQVMRAIEKENDIDGIFDRRQIPGRCLPINRVARGTFRTRLGQ